MVVQLPGPPLLEVCEVWLFDIEAMEWKLVVIDELHGCQGATDRWMDLILNDPHVPNAVSHGRSKGFPPRVRFIPCTTGNGRAVPRAVNPILTLYCSVLEARCLHSQI